MDQTIDRQKTENKAPDKTAGNEKEIEEKLGIKGAGSSSKSKKWTYGIGLILVLAAIVIGWNQFAGSDAPTYVTGTVTRGDLIRTVSATGKLEAVNTVEVGSEISGLIESVFADYNSRVEAGQLLAQLKTDRLNAEVVQAEANLNAALATLNQARASLDEQQRKTQRIQTLALSNLASPQDLESAQAALTRMEAGVQSAEAQIEVSRAALEMANTNLNKAYIRSPISGIVLTKNIESGQAVAASFQTPVLFTLAEDLSRMGLHVDIDEADISQIKVGQQATFTVDTYPDTTFPATITKVYYASKTVSDVVTYVAILSVDNEAMMLRPGMTATADITTDKIEQALLVPNSALRFTPPNVEVPEGDESLIWILDDNSQPKAIPVKTGSSNERLTAIRESDLSEGQEILTNFERLP